MTARSRAALATLIALEGMGPARLRAMLTDRTPAEALDAILQGRPPPIPPPDAVPPRLSANLLSKWQREARCIDPDELLSTYHEAGFAVVMYAEPRYPHRLIDDPDPPLVLSIDGDLDRVAARTAAIVGTRRCTRAGYDTAYQLGRDLSIAGVTVVSGLATGIDAAAHRGAVDAHGAPPLAVAGTGLDVPYPPTNAALWSEVAGAGAIVSEAPLGARADRWRFPARNRIIAGMADVVVVVESPERGGSMHTVDEADARSVEVLAVPGPVQSRNSLGTNALLYEGRGTARHAADVLLELGSRALPARPPSVAADPSDPSVSLHPAVPADQQAPARALLDAFEWQPATVDQLVLRTRLEVFDVCAILDRLVASGEVLLRGGWYERSRGFGH